MEEEGGGIDSEASTATPYTAVNFLTPDELASLNDAVRNKVRQAFNELTRNYHNAVNQKQRDRNSLERNIAALEKELTEHREKAETFNQQLSTERKTTEEYIERYRKTLTSTNELEDTVRKLQTELSQVMSKSEQLSTQKEELVSVLEKRNAENEKLAQDARCLSEQLQSATAAKISAMVKVDELTSKEMELDYKEKQLAKERDWVSKQVQLLNEELDRKNNEVIEIHRDSSLRFLSVQAEVGEKGEQLRISEQALENVKKINEDQEKHIERLIVKLKEAQDMEVKLEENYRQELKSQKRIADLYKESSEEAGKKVEELEDAVSNLQDLLKLATDRFGELETKFLNAGKSFQEEITTRDLSIMNLNKELDHANELLTNIRKQGMTDEMITSLSPAAAAACSLLKNSHSLTEIYSKHQNLNSELIIAREENEKLNNHIQEILRDVKARAPILQEQKEDYERALETVMALTNQLDLAMESETTAREELALAKKTWSSLERENKRLKVQLNDSACQIKALLREVETQRGGYSFQKPSSEDPGQEVPDLSVVTDSSKVISDRLVTFKNIDELQAQNQYLLALVREFSSSKEQEEDIAGVASQNQMEDVKKAFEDAKKELQELRETRMRQERMFQSVIEQRDSYAALVSQRQGSPARLKDGSPMKAQTDDVTASKIVELEKRLAEGQATFKQLKEEYDTYRKEKSEHEKIASEQMEKLRDDLTRMRADNAKLSSQQEYNNERAKIYNSNLESYKKNIGIMEEKNKQYNTVIVKHEQSIVTLRAELIECQQKLARTEVALASMSQERNMLADAKIRLQTERDMLVREHKTQQILQINIEEIKNNFDMAKSAEKIRLENQVENLQQECNVLRRKADTESDRFREMVFSWDKVVKELKEKLQQESESGEATKKELSITKDTIRSQRNEIEELLAKVRVLTGHSTSLSPAKGGIEGSLPSVNQVELEKKTKELNLKLIESQTEIRSLKQQLEIAKASVEEFKSLCTIMEDQIQSAATNSRNYNEEFAERLAGKDDIIRGVQARLDGIEKEYNKLKEEKEKMTRDVEGKSTHLEEELARMRRELQVANSKMVAVVEENIQLTQAVEKQTSMRDELQRKYERDISAQSDEQTLSGGLRYELTSLHDQLASNERARIAAEETLSIAQSEWEKREKALKEEMQQLQLSLKEVETVNNGLQDQLIALTTQTSSMRQARQSSEEGTTSADTSLSTSFLDQSQSEPSLQSEQERKTSEQWMQLIRYMRRQKDIANTKTEMAESSMQRMESQLKFIEKQYEEVKQKLNETQDKSHVSVITSAKQADLLRRVETLSALTDSNRMLREEKDAAFRQIEDLSSKVATLEKEMVSYRLQATEFESKCESLNSENASVKVEASRWRQRATALLEKSKQINPEEWKKLQTEKDNLTRQVQTLQESTKKQQQEGMRQMQQIKVLQQQLTTLQTTSQQEKKALADENAKIKEEVESLRSELSTRMTELSQKESELTTVTQDLTTTAAQLEEHKNTVRQVKNIARKYKKQYEDTLAEKDTLIEEKASLESQVAQATETAATTSNTTSEANETQRQQSLEDREAHQIEVIALESRIKELTDESEVLKRDMETVKSDCSQREERAKLAMKALREKMNTCNQQKVEAETELSQCKTRLASLETNADESAVRFAALKSQYDGRLGRLEKENLELKSGTSTSAGSGTSTSSDSQLQQLQQENERLKKDSEMNRQRILVLEKQYKLQQQQQQQQTSTIKAKTAVVDKLATEPPKANIKPIAGSSAQKQATQVVPPGTSRPQPTASIRPMSMPRKATVMPTPTTAAPVVSAGQAQAQSQLQPQSQSSQQQQPRDRERDPGQAVVQQSVVIAPVSQGQVSTSTPDQSSTSSDTTSSDQLAHQLPVTSSVGATSVTNSANLRQATVQPTQAMSSVAPVSSPSVGILFLAASAGTPSGSGAPGGSADVTGAPHEGPSTSSQVEDSEMGDSSEQVSSSEPSNHQLVLTVAPIRSTIQQDHVQQSSQVQSAGSSQPASASSGIEEPSPSTSSSTPRPTQSGSVTGKRVRDSEVETSQESTPSSEEPQPKRVRVANPIPVEREAEAMTHHQEQDRQSEEDEPQVPHSDTRASGSVTTGTRGEDDDFDVIVIESDEDEDDNNFDSRQTGRRGGSWEARGEAEDDADEGESDEDVEEEEELMGEEEEGEEEEDEHDSEEEHDDEDEDEEALEFQEADEDMRDDDVIADPEEGREAESLENQPASGAGSDHRETDSGGAHEADGEGDVLFIDEEEPHEEVEGNLGQDPRQAVPFYPLEVESGRARGGMGRSSTVSRAPTSSSTPARAVPLSRQPRERLSSYGRQQPLTPSFLSHQQGQMHYGDDIDDSIVPSTPTLVVPRRSDGFAEAVSSPHIPNQGRFTFGPPSDTTTCAGSSGMDDTRIDLLQYDDGTGRSVPTTPSQVSPPAEVADIDQLGEMDAHSREESSNDVQPSSSDALHRSSSNDIPTITITSVSSVLDSSLNSPMLQQEAEENASLQEEFDHPNFDGASEQVQSLPGRTESSVTSSDEDKHDVGASTSSDLNPQQPSTSTSSRPTSPSPSNAQHATTEGGDHLPPQQRVRPTPIVWDQPTSSSSVPPAAHALRTIRGRGIGGPAMRVPPQLHVSSEQSLGGNPPVRGGFRQLRGTGPQQSARRSRPHGRGPLRGSRGAF